MQKTSGAFGVVAFSYMMVWRPQDTIELLEHCYQLGAGGVQCAITGDTAKIRQRAEDLGMYIEAIVPMPRGSDTAHFEASLKAAQEVNAVSLRSACLDTRRYETFKTKADWDQHVVSSLRSIEEALPLLDRYKIPLGLENHKDWTLDEFSAILRKYGTEYFGVCLDIGNNLALLDDPWVTIERLAPYAVTTHVKDMAVESCNLGFRLLDVPLGEGLLDLKRAISLLRRIRPAARLSLEMITRDPLTISCLTDEYWATFPERSGLALARTLRFVSRHQSESPLPRVLHLPYQTRWRLENENVIKCLKYAQENLGALS